MGLLLPVFVGIGVLFGLVEAAAVDHYASKYDHIDVDSILNNRRMVNYYLDCMLSKAPCPPEGLEFKRILPEALQTNCVRCTEKQRVVTLRAIRRLKKEYPKAWAQLAELWDPDGSNFKRFEASFNTRPTESTPESSVQISNRFGEEQPTKNVIDSSTNKLSTSSSTPSTTAPVTATTNRISISTKVPSPPSSTVSTTSKISVKITTNKPTINSFTAATTKPTKRPVPNIGASIQATVSLGPQIVGDLVRGLGALGTRVVETGAEIAGVVIKSIVRPL